MRHVLRRYGRRLWWPAALLMAASLLVAWPVVAQVSVLNFFDQTSGTDNVLNINGTLEFEDKATVIDHGTTTTSATGYKSVTTNLSSIATCVLTLKKGTTPADDPVALTGLWTTGSGTLEILAWKTDGSDPTLIASATASAIGYVCFGSD